MIRKIIRKLVTRNDSVALTADYFLSCIGVRLFRRQHPLKMLLITDGMNYTSEQQVAPFRRFRRQLRAALVLVPRFVSVEYAVTMADEAFSRYDFIGLKFSFRADETRSMEFARRIHRAIAGTSTRLIYFDGDDDLNIQWPGLVELADVYVKGHTYRDRAELAVPRVGRCNLTDWLAAEHGCSFDDDEFPRSRPVDPALAEKVVAGWNLALGDPIARLARRLPQPSPESRPIDICSRATAPVDSCIYPLRSCLIDRLEQMSSSMKVSVPRGRVSLDQYYQELQSSIICVSPFGHGEICWRDFEAVICGCLLVKPDMSHVETEPNIFEAGVTYVPVKWDYSDLQHVCEYYLRNQQEREEIIRQAHARLTSALQPQWFLDRVQKILAVTNRQHGDAVRQG